MDIKINRKFVIITYTSINRWNNTIKNKILKYNKETHEIERKITPDLIELPKKMKDLDEFTV